MSIKILLIDGREPGETAHFYWTCNPDELPEQMRVAFRDKHKFFNVDLENGDEIGCYGGLIFLTRAEGDLGEEHDEDEEVEELAEPIRKYLYDKTDGTRNLLRDDDDDELPKFTHLITLIGS